MKNHFIYAVVATAIMASAVVLGSSRVPLQSEISTEEYAVYSAVIGEMFAGGKVTFDTGSEVKLLVIKGYTVGDFLRADVENQDWKYLRQQFPSISQETINDYVAKSKEAYELKDAFDLKLNHTLVKKGEVEGMFKGGVNGWEAFYKRFPDSGGLVGVSRVGFNPEMNQALMYVEHGCGGLCGTGHYVLLNKGEGGWKVAKRFMAWIS
jgi:hypothetical protein